MEISPIKTKIFQENEDLISFIFKYVKNLKENSILDVTSKIVALSEGRVVEYINEAQRNNLIKKESDFAMKTKIVWLTIRDGMVMANAGIDESNAKSKLILLPKDSFKSASMIRTALCKKFNVKNLGVLITDSRLIPLRKGVVGVALGYAGFQGIKNNIGKKDLFGKILKMSQTDMADGLATSAVLCMGEARECQPLAMITEAPVVFVKKVNKSELVIDPKKDIYAPLFANFKKNEKKK